MRKKLKLFYILFLFFFFQMFLENVYAEEPILISISSNLDQVVFDGKWTNPLEWKQSSYNRLYYDDDAKIHLRTAHQGNFIYVQINFESDKIIDKDLDSAMICFDTKNDKSIIPQSDDYCFSTILGEKKSFTYQGNMTSTNNFFNNIPNDKNFVAIGTASDKFDRYSKIPHASYEFRIPLDLLGRSDNYGFYVSIFDGNSKNYYSWPYEIETYNQTSFSSPNQWGDLISPDKSLPEFNYSIPFIISLLIIFVIITKLDLFKIHIFRF